jgi:hypothetical protein
VFENSVHKEAFSSLPKGFKSEVLQDGRLRLSKCINPKSGVERMKAIMESSIDLLEWATNLSETIFFWIEFELEAGFNIQDFKNSVSEKLQLFNPTTKSSESDIIQTFYTTEVSPDKEEELTEKIEIFAKALGVKVTVEAGY